VFCRACADFSDLEIGPDGCLYLLSDKSSTIARLDDLPAGGGTASLLDAWQLGDLDGKPEGLAFTAEGRAVVAVDTRKPRRNLVLLEPAFAQSLPDGASSRRMASSEPGPWWAARRSWARSDEVYSNAFFGDTERQSAGPPKLSPTWQALVSNVKKCVEHLAADCEIAAALEGC
jgi:hypothetical protein